MSAPDVSRSAHRPPILNPYDRFNQTDFDSWIGSITGALRHALGQEELHESPVEKKNRRSVSEPPHHDVSHEMVHGEDFVEDSLAEIKKRRAITKGKARDPREGPGLSEGWNKEDPIEILSDSDGEGAESPLIQRGDSVFEDEEAAYELEYEDEEQDEDETEEVKAGTRRSHSSHSGESSQGEGSHDHDLKNFPQSNRQRPSITASPDRGSYGEEEEEEKEEEEGEAEQYEEEWTEGEEYEDSDLDRSVSPAPQARHQPPVQVIYLESDEETELELEQEDAGEFVTRSSPFYAEAHLSDKDATGEEIPKEDSHAPALDVRSYDEKDQLQSDRDEDNGETESLEDSTILPPLFQRFSDEHPKIRDPWSGSRVYAKDYSGGGAPRFQKSPLDPHHLADNVPSSQIVEESQENIHDDEDFLPEHPEDGERLYTNIEIPHVWEAASIYAEDFYSGGDSGHSDGEILDPHHLGFEQVQNEPEIIDLDAEEENDLQAIIPIPSSFAHAPIGRSRLPIAQSALSTDSAFKSHQHQVRDAPSGATAQDIEMLREPAAPVDHSSLLFPPPLSFLEESEVLLDGEYDLEYPQVSRVSSMDEDETIAATEMERELMPSVILPESVEFIHKEVVQRDLGGPPLEAEGSRQHLTVVDLEGEPELAEASVLFDEFIGEEQVGEGKVSEELERVIVAVRVIEVEEVDDGKEEPEPVQAPSIGDETFVEDQREELDLERREEGNHASVTNEDIELVDEHESEPVDAEVIELDVEDMMEEQQEQGNKTAEPTEQGYIETPSLVVAEDNTNFPGVPEPFMDSAINVALNDDMIVEQTFIVGSELTTDSVDVLGVTGIDISGIQGRVAEIDETPQAVEIAMDYAQGSLAIPSVEHVTAEGGREKANQVLEEEADFQADSQSVLVIEGVDTVVEQPFSRIEEVTGVTKQVYEEMPYYEIGIDEALDEDAGIPAVANEEGDRIPHLEDAAIEAEVGIQAYFVTEVTFEDHNEDSYDDVDDDVQVISVSSTGIASPSFERPNGVEEVEEDKEPSKQYMLSTDGVETCSQDEANEADADAEVPKIVEDKDLSFQVTLAERATMVKGVLSGGMVGSTATAKVQEVIPVAQTMELTGGTLLAINQAVSREASQPGLNVGIGDDKARGEICPSNDDKSVNRPTVTETHMEQSQSPAAALEADLTQVALQQKTQSTTDNLHDQMSISMAVEQDLNIRQGRKGPNYNRTDFESPSELETAKPIEAVEFLQGAVGEPIQTIRLPQLGLADPYPASMSTPSFMDQAFSFLPHAFQPTSSIPSFQAHSVARVASPWIFPIQEPNRQGQVTTHPNQPPDNMLGPPFPPSHASTPGVEMSAEKGLPYDQQLPFATVPLQRADTEPEAKSTVSDDPEASIYSANPFISGGSTAPPNKPANAGKQEGRSTSRALQRDVNSITTEKPAASRAMLAPASTTSHLPQRTQTSGGKRKRGDFPKKARTGSAQKSFRKKSTKSKDKLSNANFDGPLDGGDEIHVKPRDKAKLALSAVGTGRPPVSTSASTKSGSSACSAARLVQPGGSRASSIASEFSEQRSQPSPTTHKPTNVKSKRASRKRGSQSHPGSVTGLSPLEALSTPESQSKTDLTPRGWQHQTSVYVQSEAQPTAVAKSQVHPTDPTPPAQFQDPPSLFHAHGQKMKAMQLQHHRTMPAQSRLQHSPLQIGTVRQSPLWVSDTPATRPTAHTAPRDGPQTPTVQSSFAYTPSTTRRTQSVKSLASNSPVTRSHCRFHKISIPRDEAGPRIFFVVPGCSLTKPNIIEEEEIEDHGDATYADSKRMVDDIESLGFEPYLIAVLKSLVGSDIMHSQDIYYLPLEGENTIRTQPTFTQPIASSSKGFSGLTLASSRFAKAGQGLDVGNASESEGDDCFSDPDYEESQPSFKRPKAATGRKGRLIRSERESLSERKPASADTLVDYNEGTKPTKRPRTSSVLLEPSVADDGAPEAKKARLDNSPA